MPKQKTTTTTTRKTKGKADSGKKKKGTSFGSLSVSDHASPCHGRSD